MFVIRNKMPPTARRERAGKSRKARTIAKRDKWGTAVTKSAVPVFDLKRKTFRQLFFYLMKRKPPLRYPWCKYIWWEIEVFHLLTLGLLKGDIQHHKTQFTAWIKKKKHFQNLKKKTIGHVRHWYYSQYLFSCRFVYFQQTLISFSWPFPFPVHPHLYSTPLVRNLHSLTISFSSTLF